MTFNNGFLLGFEISSTGNSGAWLGEIMGRFEPIIGEVEGGCQVYKQAHSREMPSVNTTLLFAVREGEYSHLKTECTYDEDDLPPFLFPESKDEWLVGRKGCGIALMASVGPVPNQPPTTGWKFYNDCEYEADEGLTCRVFASSLPCCLTVSLSGAAKEAQAKCEGEYKSTGLVSKGRPVITISSHLYVVNLSLFSLRSSNRRELLAASSL